MAVLSRRCGWLEPDEREEIFQDACLVVLERERDGRLDADQMVPAQLRAFLVQTSINKALDEGKRVGRARSVPLEDAELNIADGARAPEEIAAAGLEGARVREIVGDLSERKRAIVKLRFFFDRSPDEIQSFLGISERVYRRDLERAMRQIQDGYQLVREGSYCDSRRSGIIALVSGIAGPARAQAAREHLASCPSCAAWAAQLREAAREVGALAPMPDLLLPDGPLERLVNAIEGLRGGLLDAGAGAKQHASALAARLDHASAGVLSSARPGAGAGVLLGCLAIGGGATYCVVEGVPEPLRGVTDSIVGEPREDREPAVRALPPAQPPAPAAATGSLPMRGQAASEKAGKRKTRRQRQQGSGGERGTSPAPVQSSEPAPTPEPAPEPAPEPEPEPVPEEEFGFEGEPAPAAPAPSSPSGGGEFGP